MAARTINLPNHVANWIDEQVARGRFASEDEVIVDLAEHAMAPHIDWNDDPALHESIIEIDRGEGVKVPDITALFDQIERRASEAAAQGDRVPVDLKY